MKGEDPVRLGEVLKEAAGALGIGGAVETGIIWRRWREVVGEGIADHAEPTSFRNGVLRIRADSPVWGTEIGYLAGEIRSRLNAALGGPAVREIKVWTGPAPARRGPQTGPARGPETAAGRTGETEAGGDLMGALQRARKAWERRRRKTGKNE